MFAKELRNPERFSHLRNLFIIIPPLTINFVEYLISARSRLMRGQNSSDYIFVDDGFATGIGFMLSVLKQDFFFDSLNWFKSVNRSLKRSMDSNNKDELSAHKNKDQSFALTLSIRSGRLAELQSEFKYLKFTLHSARMFFNCNQAEDDAEEHFLEDI